MQWYEWLLLALTIGVAVGCIVALRAATRATERDLRRMVFPLVDALLHVRDDADDTLPPRGRS